MADDDVQLTDLEVIQQFSLAVRGGTASRAAVKAALEADLAFLNGSGRRTAPARPAAPMPSAAPEPALDPEPAAKAPITTAPKAPAKKAAARPAATKAPVKKAATKVPVKKAVKKATVKAAAKATRGRS